MDKKTNYGTLIKDTTLSVRVKNALMIRFGKDATLGHVSKCTLEELKGIRFLGHIGQTEVIKYFFTKNLRFKEV